MTKEHTTNSQLRSFGLIIGGIFGIIALWPMIIRGQEPRWWAMALVASFVVPALALPSSLRPIHRIWMLIGHILGWINTRIILAIGFYGIVTPVGLAMRVFGKDPMRRQYLPRDNTYRVTRISRPGRHMQQQF